jgi:hypothetical protein
MQIKPMSIFLFNGPVSTCHLIKIFTFTLKTLSILFWNRVSFHCIKDGWRYDLFIDGIMDHWTRDDY